MKKDGFGRPFFVHAYSEFVYLCTPKIRPKKMALIQTMEATGAKLFKYRGQIPVLIFVLAIPGLAASFNTDLAESWYFNPTASTLTVAIAFLTSLCGLALRAYTVSTTPKGTSGRNTASQVANTLNTKGIYSVVRHPLYLANYLIWLGVLIYSRNLFVIIIVSLVYWIYYERIMMAEEAYLRGKFGDEFEEWAAKVPAFLPKWSRFEGGMLQFSWKTFVRREYATWLSTVYSYLATDWILYQLWRLQMESCYGKLKGNYITNHAAIFWIAVTYTIIALIIKLIKHKTTWLDAPPDRD